MFLALNCKKIRVKSNEVKSVTDKDNFGMDVYGLG